MLTGCYIQRNIDSYYITSLEITADAGTHQCHTRVDSGDQNQRPHLRVLTRLFTLSYDHRSLFNSSLALDKVNKLICILLIPSSVGNLGVIVVPVCKPVFRNLPYSYTWPLKKNKKQTHSYTWSSKMLTHSYTALWLLYPFIAGS